MKEAIFLACIASGVDPNSALSCQVFRGTEIACIQMLHEKIDRSRRNRDERVSCVDMRGNGFVITGRS